MFPIQSFLGRIPVDRSRLAVRPANGTQSNSQSSVNNDKNTPRRLKLLPNTKRRFFSNIGRYLYKNITFGKVPKTPLFAASNALAS